MDKEPLLRPREGLEGLAKTFQEVKFRKKLLGGVDELDVWRKLEQLQQEYERLYHRQAAYYQALLEEREQALARLRQDGGGVARG